jgi:hypothetical protein
MEDSASWTGGQLGPWANQGALDAEPALDVDQVGDIYVALVRDDGGALNAGTTVQAAVGISSAGPFAGTFNLGTQAQLLAPGNFGQTSVPAKFIKLRGTLNAADFAVARLIWMGRRIAATLGALLFALLGACQGAGEGPELGELPAALLLESALTEHAGAAEDDASFAECRPVGVFAGQTVTCRSRLPGLAFHWSTPFDPGVLDAPGEAVTFQAPALCDPGTYRVVPVVVEGVADGVHVRDSVHLVVVSELAGAVPDH